MDFNWAMEQARNLKIVTRENYEKWKYVKRINGYLCVILHGDTENHREYSADTSDIFANDWKIYDPHNSLHEFDNAVKNLQRATDDFVKAMAQIGKKLMNHA